MRLIIVWIGCFSGHHHERTQGGAIGTSRGKTTPHDTRRRWQRDSYESLRAGVKIYCFNDCCVDGVAAAACIYIYIYVLL
jgi:hypothetical protein